MLLLVHVLLHVLAMGYLLVHSPLWTWMARISPTNFLTRLGRNSLPVFVAGSLMSMVGYITLVQTGNHLGIELALTVVGIAVMWMTALVSEIGLVAVATRTADLCRSVHARLARQGNFLGKDMPNDIVSTVRTGQGG